MQRNSEIVACNLTIFTNFGIDIVALEPIPEPSTLILFGTTAAMPGPRSLAKAKPRVALRSHLPDTVDPRGPKGK
jgi:hypothetical protein